MNEFDPICKEIEILINQWESIFRNLSENIISERRNKQNRNIKQIIGHMIDSASNNTHRTVHMQYNKNPLHFPNYATNGNNDRWISIQNYNGEDWKLLINLWKYSNLHIIHVFRNADNSKIENQWYCSEEKLVTMKECIIDYLRHFKLHLSEIDELINTD